ncbi:hypothetical protein Trydic_g15381 [Trypoxylus dichotomus]
MSNMFSGKRIRIVRFEECDLEPTDAEFYKEFSKYNEVSWWIVLLFLMTAFCHFSVKLDDSMEEHGSVREVSCIYDGLRALDWPIHDIIEVFYPDIGLACSIYGYNITELKLLPYEEALEKAHQMETPELVCCSDPVDDKTFSWDPTFFGTCKAYLYKQRILGSRAVGIAIGSIILGFTADILGRKVALTISIGLYFLGTTTQTLFRNFIIVRMTTGIRGVGRAGIDQALQLLMLEHAGKVSRPYLVIYATALGSVGLLAGVDMKRNLQGYCKELRFILVIPSLIFLFYMWYVPESPRWYLSYCRKKKAWLVLHKLGTRIDQLHFLPDIQLGKIKLLTENMTFLCNSWKLLRIILLGTLLLTFVLFTEFSKTQYVTLKYLRPYSHHAILALARIFSFMYLLLPVMMLRRRLALLWFHSLISFQLFITLFIDDVIFYVINTLIFVCAHAARSILRLYLTEVFPTCIRGTSFGLIRCIAISFHAFYFSYDQRVSHVKTLLERLLYVFASLSTLIMIWFLPEIRLGELPDYKRYRRDYKIA